MESVLSESKLEQSVIVEGNGNKNSADVCKRKGDRPIFAEIAPNNDITDNKKFRQKRSKTYAETLQRVEVLVAKFLNHWKQQMLWKKKMTISTEL